MSVTLIKNRAWPWTSLRVGEGINIAGKPGCGWDILGCFGGTQAGHSLVEIKKDSLHEVKPELIPGS